MLWPLCNQIVNLETEAKTLYYSSLKKTINQTNRIFHQKNLQIDSSFFAAYGTHAMNDFVSLEIFMRQGRRVQRKQIHSNALVDATLRVVTVTLYCSSQLQQPLCHFTESCPCQLC